MAVITKRVAIVGTSFRPGATDFLQNMKPRTALALQRDPRNKYDPNAIAVGSVRTERGPGRMLGYIPRGLAAELAPLMDRGVEIKMVRAPVIGCVGTIQYDDGKD